MEFITLRNPGVKKQPNVISNIREYECKCLFLIFVHANANSEKTCEYLDHH